MDAITLNAAGGATTLTAAVQRGNQHVVWAWAEVLLDKLPRHMVSLKAKLPWNMVNLNTNHSGVT